MIPDLSVLWVIASCCCCRSLLDRLLLRPITRVMSEREGAIRSARELAESSRAKAQAAADELEAKTRAARADVYRQMDEKRRAALDRRMRARRRDAPAGRAHDERGDRDRSARRRRPRARSSNATPMRWPAPLSSACSAGKLPEHSVMAPLQRSARRAACEKPLKRRRRFALGRGASSRWRSAPRSARARRSRNTRRGRRRRSRGREHKAPASSDMIARVVNFAILAGTLGLPAAIAARDLPARSRCDRFGRTWCRPPR